jgi:hypothetical protein
MLQFGLTYFDHQRPSMLGEDPIGGQDRQLAPSTDDLMALRRSSSPMEFRLWCALLAALVFNPIWVAYVEIARPSLGRRDSTSRGRVRADHFITRLANKAVTANDQCVTWR